MSVEVWLLHSLAGVTKGNAVDVGANIGSWSRLLSSLFSSVVAVEADPRAFSALTEKLPANVTPICGAVCGHEGFASLYTRPSAEQSSLLEVHPIGAGACKEAPVHEVLEVRAYTLDSLCPLGADYVKMDIEGAEVMALSAASADVWGAATFLVECHDTFEAVNRELERMRKSVERVAHPYPAHPGHCWAIGRPMQ